MSDTNADEREQGIDFQGLDAELESHDYPTTVGDLVDEYGDHELSLQNGTVTLAEIFEPVDEEQEFESANEVETTIYNFVGDDAVGPDDYSDRGTGADEEESDAV